MHAFIHSFIHSMVDLSISSFNYSSLHPFISSFIHSFIINCVKVAEDI